MFFFKFVNLGASVNRPRFIIVMPANASRLDINGIRGCTHPFPQAGEGQTKTRMVMDKKQ